MSEVMQKKIPLCSCGFPQSFPIPHEHDRTEREKQIMDYYENLIAHGPEVEARIICLCGSTRFTDIMLIESWEIAKQGMIALGWHALPDSYFDGKPKSHMADEEGVREIVDEVHKRKIDLADEILVINVGGYIGDSTKSEIRYAAEKEKPIYFYEPVYAEENLCAAGVRVKEEK